MNTYSFVEGNEPNDSDYAPIEFKNNSNKNIVGPIKNGGVKESSKKECFSPIFKFILIGLILLFLYENLFSEQNSKKYRLLNLSNNIQEISSFYN